MKSLRNSPQGRTYENSLSGIIVRTRFARLARSQHRFQLIAFLLVSCVLLAGCKKEQETKDPKVTTAAVTNITSNSAVGGGEVVAEGSSAVTERGICWSTNPTPTISDSHANSGAGLGAYTIEMTDLTEDASYFVRAYAVNKQGVFYGEEVSFLAKEPTVDNCFSIEGGTLISGEMPSPTSNIIIDASINPNVIPGGSLLINVPAPDNVTIHSILVGIKGEYGYYEVIPNSSDDQPNKVILIISPLIDLGESDSLTIYIAITDENDNVSQVLEKEVHLIMAGTGRLQVSLSFDNCKDIDLHLSEPHNYYPGHSQFNAWAREHIYFANRLSANGGELDLDSNPNCHIDSINNENITYGADAYIEPGWYWVGVNMWRNCDPSIATDYIVTVHYDGELIAFQEGTFPIDEPDNNTYGDLNLSGVLCNIHEHFTFCIPYSGQKKVKDFEPVPLSESAREKMGMEKE